MEQNNAPSTSAPSASHGTTAPQLEVAKHEELIHRLRGGLHTVVENRYDKLGEDLDAVVQAFRSNMDADVHMLIGDYLRTKTELIQLQVAYNRLQDEKAAQSPFQPGVPPPSSLSLAGTDSLQHQRELHGLHHHLQLQQHTIQQLQGELQITGSELHRAMDDVQNLKNVIHELTTRLRSYEGERVGLHQTIVNKTAVNNQIATVLEHRQREINEYRQQLDTLWPELQKLRAFVARNAAAANIAQTVEAAREDSLHAHASRQPLLAPVLLLGPGPTSPPASWPANTIGQGPASPPGPGLIPNSASWPVQTVGLGSVLPPPGPPMALWPSQNSHPVIDHTAKEGAPHNNPERLQPSQQAHQLVPPNQPQLSYQSQRLHQLQESQQPRQRQVLHAALSFQARPARGRKANASSPKRDISQQSMQLQQPLRQLQHPYIAPTSPTNTDNPSVSSSPAIPATVPLPTAAAIEKRDDNVGSVSIATSTPLALVSTPTVDPAADPVDTIVQDIPEKSQEVQVLATKDPLGGKLQQKDLEQHDELGPEIDELGQDQGTETETETETEAETETDDPEQHQETDTDDQEQHQEMEVDELEQYLEVEADELQHDQEPVSVEQQHRQQQQVQRAHLPQRQQGKKRSRIIQNDGDENELMDLNQSHTRSVATTTTTTHTSTPTSRMKQEQDILVERRRGSPNENWRQPGRWYLSSIEIPMSKRSPNSREPTPIGDTSRPRGYSTRSSTSMSTSPSPSNGSNAATGSINGDSITAFKKGSSHTFVKTTSRLSPSLRLLTPERRSSPKALLIPSSPAYKSPTTVGRLGGRLPGRRSSTTSTGRSGGQRRKSGTFAFTASNLELLSEAKADSEQRNKEDGDETDDDSVKTKDNNGVTEEDKDGTEDEQTEDEETEDEQTEDDDQRTEDDDEQTDDEFSAGIVAAPKRLTALTARRMPPVRRVTVAAVKQRPLVELSTPVPGSAPTLVSVSGSGSAPAPGLFSFSPSDSGTVRLDGTGRQSPRIGVPPAALQKGAR